MPHNGNGLVDVEFMDDTTLYVQGGARNLVEVEHVLEMLYIGHGAL